MIQLFTTPDGLIVTGGIIGFIVLLVIVGIVFKLGTGR